MKVRMRYQLSGTRDGEPWPAPGEEINLSDHEAAKYCANGIAEPVTATKAEKQTGGLTTSSAPKRGPSRPRKSAVK